MDLTKLASAPQLIKLTLDTEDIIEKYGESLDFYIYDRQPLEQFIKIATLKDSTEDLIMLVKDMILDVEGKSVMKEGTSLPTDVMTRVIQKVVESLGK